MIRRLEFHLSYACVQRCVFCSESARMDRFRLHPLGLGEISDVLMRKRREGFDHLTLTGGEPTLHPNFLGALKAAKRLGYATYVTSNGCRLAEAGFARQALPFIDELCLSVHGDRPRLHDAMAAASGSFRRLDAAFRNVQLYGPKVFLLTNTVVTKRNAGSVKAVLRFVLRQAGVRHCLLSNVAPEGRGARGYRRLAVPLAEWRRLIPGLAKVAEEGGVTLRFFGLPLCVFGRHRALSNDLHYSPRATVERMRLGGRPGLHEVVTLAPTRERLQPSRCGPCGARRLCGGVFERYLSEFGDQELKPVLKAEADSSVPAWALTSA